jgi:hypothetical protein
LPGLFVFVILGFGFYGFNPKSKIGNPKSPYLRSRKSSGIMRSPKAAGKVPTLQLPPPLLAGFSNSKVA